MKTFNEEYLVSFDYQNEEGYWRNGDAPEVILVKVVSGMNEKNNHEKAREIFIKKFPNRRVLSVTYA